MKSTPDQTQKRRELVRLVTQLGQIAWKCYPKIAEGGIIASEDSPVENGVVDYDEFFVLQHDTKTLPAVKTGGRVFLRFRRRISRDRKYEALWHFWEPEYAGTKSESVEELLPVVRSQIALLRDSTEEKATSNRNVAS